MKSLLARFAVHHAIGIAIDDQEIAVSRVAFTPLGPVETARSREACGADGQAAALERILAPARSRFGPLRPRVVIGVPAARVFFSTRPVQSVQQDATPQELLHKVLQSPNISIDDMAVDLIRTQPGGRAVASIASCRRKHLAGPLSALESCGIIPTRVEPAPCALLRAATLRYKDPRRVKVLLRIFLGEGQGLAVLVASGVPLMWRSFTLPAGHETGAIDSVIGSIRILGRHCGIEPSLDAILVHGRADLALQPDDLTTRAGARVSRFPGPALDNAETAFGLALGGSSHVEAFDLARSLKPRPSLWDVFPFGELALQASVLICVALFLLVQSRDRDATHRKVMAEAGEHAWMATVADKALEDERAALDQKVEAIRSFLVSRNIWTTYLHDTAARQPPNITIKSLIGQSDPPGKGKGGSKEKRSLVIRVAATSRGNVVPREIDTFLDALRGDSALKRDFPTIEMNGLSLTRSRDKSASVAEFTVVCLPKSSKAEAKKH